ncbi:MAG: tetratricopeptide repeat protein [Myxococcales bacterium]|nr:tetratricopeptide repeat protein [Myxococcales bacterium]
MSKRLEMLEKMIEKGTDDPFVRYARALELRSAGRLDETMAAFEDVRTRHPDYVPTYLMAGQVAIELERDADARAWLEQGLERAQAAGDEHARSELQQALDGLD